jgi:hypothetical protein
VIPLNNFSRLRFAPLLTADGVEFWDLLDLPAIPEQSDDLAHAVIGTDRIDLLAQKYYGSPVLWWVIAVANDLELLPSDLYTGQLLRIPAPRYVLREFFQNTRHRAV